MVLLLPCCTSYPLPTLPHSTNIRQWCLCSPHHDTLGYCRKSLRGLVYLHHQQHKGVSKGETRQGDKSEGSWSEQAARKLPDFPHELFTFLSEKIASTAWPDGYEVFSTSDTRVVGTEPSHSMLPCNHEEADTRIMIHLLDALERGYSTRLVRTVDTDVVVILIGISMPCSPSSYCRYLDRFWHCTKVHMSSYECHLSLSGQRIVRSTSHVPLLHRLWHNLSILREGEEISMEGLGFLPWGHSGLQLHGSKSALSLDIIWPHFKLQWSTKKVVLPEEQNDRTHPTNSRFPAAAVKTSCLPVWNMGDMWTGPSADIQSTRMWMDFGWRQPCKASCLEHSVDGFESLPSTGQVRLLQKRKWLWWKELVQEDTLEPGSCKCDR